MPDGHRNRTGRAATITIYLRERRGSKLPDRSVRRRRRGLLGTILALATPLLPVEQTTAQLKWPQSGTLTSVEAPLIGYVATELNITVPCRAAAGLAGPQNTGKTVLLSTVPKQAPTPSTAGCSSSAPTTTWYWWCAMSRWSALR
ncbi:mycobacterial cell wall arabinan synthesis family protein [Mycobacterium kansasii]|uniref:Mycobacterial cell wall arabinan synthesis family protein n=1 Tax=Mycobacterium kansasii TaxID=1768 RepID=A0A1V3X9W7_MYCKA|nr:mycobacterial cell wall arabinan synthesis family protein [Mycobacterium kansasii]